jgi:PKD repeat protein
VIYPPKDSTGASSSTGIGIYGGGGSTYYALGHVEVAYNKWIGKDYESTVTPGSAGLVSADTILAYYNVFDEVYSLRLTGKNHLELANNTMVANKDVSNTSSGVYAYNSGSYPTGHILNNIVATKSGYNLRITPNTTEHVVIENNIGTQISGLDFMVDWQAGIFQLTEPLPGTDYVGYPVDFVGNAIFVRDIGAYEFGEYEPPVCNKPNINDFWYASETTKVGMPVQFTADVVSDCPVSYNWTFGFGSPHNSSDPNPSIIWNKAGLFDVSLEVTSDGGQHYLQKTNYVVVVDDVIPDPCDTVYIHDTTYLIKIEYIYIEKLPEIKEIWMQTDPHNIYYKDGVLHIKQPPGILLREN